MEDQSNKIWGHIADYLEEECPSEERIAVERWLAEHPTNRVLFERIQRTWAQIQARPQPAVDLAALKARIARGIGVAHLDTREATDVAYPVSPNSGRQRPHLHLLSQTRQLNHPKQGGHSGLTMLTRARTLFNELTSRAVALVDGEDTELKKADIERLRSLVEQAELEDK
jgi:hypothetical protein